jgi:hypothetical protein
VRVRTSITEGTANFLVNRRMNKSQQMRWSRNGADLLLQVRCAVYNGTLGAGFGHRFDRISNSDLAFAKAAWSLRSLDGPGPIASFTADGAYDQDGVYGEIAERYPDAPVIVPPRSSAVPSKAAETAPTQRDRHLQLIAERGRIGWQKASRYNLRALVEADIGRWKRVIGEALHSQTDGCQATEVAIAAGVLNRMLELGRPEYVRIVWN